MTVGNVKNQAFHKSLRLALAYVGVVQLNQSCLQDLAAITCDGLDFG